MPRITAIEIQRRHKDKVRIFLDDQFVCILTAITVLSARLKVGDDVTTEQLDHLLHGSECQIAFQKACDAISRSFKTVKQMREYLTQKGFDERVVDKTVEKLIYYKYLNDAEYARMYTQSVAHKKGKKGIVFDLQNKGIGADMIENAVAVIDQDANRESCLSVAKKYMKNRQAYQKNLQSLFRHLQYKGYDYEDILAVVKSFYQDN